MSAKPKQQKTELQGMASWRLVLVLLVFGSLLSVIVGRLVYLHTIDHPFLYEQGEKRTLRTETQPAVRGTITDRYGKPLAVSTPVVDLWINPKLFSLEKTAEVASVMGMPAVSLRKRIQTAQQQGRSFIYLKRQVQPALAQNLLQKKIEGVYGEDTYRRFYPAAEVTAQTVGIVNIDGRGQEGLELAYDQYLNGTPGSRKVVKDLSGNIIKQLQVKEVAKPGGDLALTLDLRLQYVAYRELTAAVNQHRAGSGSAVLLDAATGEILALVSHPSYNPNNRAGLKAENMRNRAIADLIEPGSTIKPFVVAAALMSGDYKPHTQVNTAPGYMRIKNKTIRDHRNYGVLDVTGIITKSSNIGVTKLAQHLGAERLWQFYTKAGIGQANLLGFPGEAIGQMPYPEQLDSLGLATVSYGYGLAMSPLQLANAYTNLTQEGCHKPLKIQMSSGDTTPCEPVMTKEVSRQVLDMLQTVISAKGTGSRAQVSGYTAGGKTGTAHRVGRSGYEHDSYTAVFAGIAPIGNPDLVLVVVIDDPKGKEYYGGEVAAPVFSRIMEQALRLRQVLPDDGSAMSIQIAGGSL